MSAFKDTCCNDTQTWSQCSFGLSPHVQSHYWVLTPVGLMSKTESRVCQDVGKQENISCDEVVTKDRALVLTGLACWAPQKLQGELGASFLER